MFSCFIKWLFVSDAVVCRRMFHQLLNINLSIYYYLIVFFVPCVRGKKIICETITFYVSCFGEPSSFNLLLACIWLTCVAAVLAACSTTTRSYIHSFVIHSHRTKLVTPLRWCIFSFVLFQILFYFIFMECILIFHLARNVFFFFFCL